MSNKIPTNNLSITHPHLAKEWNIEKNDTLKPEHVTPGSGKKVWWICSKKHEWNTYVYSRTGNKSGCPTCAKEKFVEGKKNYRPPFEKTIAFLNPKLAGEWDFEKNGERGPDTYTEGSNKKVCWKCAEGHEWEAVIATRKKTNCPYCSGQRVTREKSFGSLHPHLLKEWHPEKNNEKTAFDFMPNTHKKAWFLCEHGHEWEAYIANRTKGKGCPYCSGHKPTNETSLLATNPKLCEEWNSEKNGDKIPNDFKPFSNEKVWWRCSKGHEWSAAIYSRQDGRGCPDCSRNSQTSFPEQAIFYYIKKLFPETENRKKLEFLANNAEADIFIDSLNLAIEYDGYHHMNELERDERKNVLMKENNIQLIRVRQFVGDRKLPNIENSDSFVIEHDYNHKKGLDKCIGEILAYLIEKYSLDVASVDVDSNRDRGEILKQMNENERNLEMLFPLVSEEWHPTKNSALMPNQVSPFSHLKVWWRCEKNDKHEWEATIANRANGRKCPYCLNRKINETNSLMALAPQMGKQWHPTKNGALNPNEIALNYGKKVWWLCERGHEWETTPNNRVNSSNNSRCPLCYKEERKSSV
ncbi:zinc-ribbon domain-containing protein [Paenisporosarcina sp. FSL H8-0542]|uniref:zinc-ribbon domain-containing protein n=1 Tax=Paenisporosarcina sp. FSL H8-0542 TaxID=2921401 RepID=UPI003159DAE0